jgi:hypothetical protein
MSVANSAVNSTVQKIIHLSQPYYTETFTSVRMSYMLFVRFSVYFSFSYMFREFTESMRFFLSRIVYHEDFRT